MKGKSRVAEVAHDECANTRLDDLGHFRVTTVDHSGEYRIEGESGAEHKEVRLSA